MLLVLSTVLYQAVSGTPPAVTAGFLYVSVPENTDVSHSLQNNACIVHI